MQCLRLIGYCDVSFQAFLPELHRVVPDLLPHSQRRLLRHLLLPKNVPVSGIRSRSCLRLGANFTRLKFKVKSELAEFYRTSMQTLSLVFLSESKFVSTSEELTLNFVE